MAALFSEAFFDFCIFGFCVFSCHRLRSFPTASFKMGTFLKILGAGMLLISFSQCILSMTPLISAVELQQGNLLDRFNGNPLFASWQFLYTAGISLLNASKVLVLLRLLEFSENSQKKIPSSRKIKCIRVSLWSIWSVCAVSGIISAAILVVDSLIKEKQRFSQLTTAIVVIRSLEFLMLAVMFAYSGVMRWVPIAAATASPSRPFCHTLIFFPAFSQSGTKHNS